MTTGTTRRGRRPGSPRTTGREAEHDGERPKAARAVAKAWRRRRSGQRAWRPKSGMSSARAPRLFCSSSPGGNACNVLNTKEDHNTRARARKRRDNEEEGGRPRRRQRRQRRRRRRAKQGRERREEDDERRLGTSEVRVAVAQRNLLCQGSGSADLAIQISRQRLRIRRRKKTEAVDFTP